METTLSALESPTGPAATRARLSWSTNMWASTLVAYLLDRCEADADIVDSQRFLRKENL